MHGDLDQIGTDPDGYPIYDSVREASFVLTNSSRTTRSTVASIGLAKMFDNGFDFTVGYAYSDAEDVNPMVSSVAFSNYQNRAFFDPQEDVPSTSNYNSALAQRNRRLRRDHIAENFGVIMLFGDDLGDFIPCVLRTPDAPCTTGGTIANRFALTAERDASGALAGTSCRIRCMAPGPPSDNRSDIRPLGRAPTIPIAP